MGVVSISFLGFLLGLRHALDADHVAAISTIVAEHYDVQRSSLIGFFWGMGHTLTLMLVGIPVLLFHWVVPEWFGKLAEISVGFMLLYLGGSLFIKMVADRIHWHAHMHDQIEHVHAHSHRKEVNHSHPHFQEFSVRSFTVGTVHGLAGSAALLLLILGTISSWIQGVLYLLLFGLGVTLGMTLLTMAFAWPFSWGKGKWSFEFPLTFAAGLASLVVGTNLLLRNLQVFPT